MQDFISIYILAKFWPDFKYFQSENLHRSMSWLGMQNGRSVTALRNQKTWPTILNSKSKVTLRFRSWGSEPKANPIRCYPNQSKKKKTFSNSSKNNYSTTLSLFWVSLSPLQKTLLQKDRFLGGSILWFFKLGMCFGF